MGVYGNMIDTCQNVLVGLVKKDNISQYLDNSATIYYTGKRFPSTIEIDKLCYFVPYLSGQGIRDLYKIKVVRIGTKEGMAENSLNDYRLVFDIEYVKPLSREYKQMKLDIWHTYTMTTLQEIK